MNYLPEQLMQRPSCPAAFADVESVGKDLRSIAICIHLHARLEVDNITV